MLNENEIRQLASQGYTLSQAASKIGCQRASLSNFCDKNGIKFTKKQHASLQVSLSTTHLALGSRLADLMVSNGVSTNEVSLATGVSRGILKRFCYGVQDLRISDVKKVCDYFGLTMEEFFAGV